MKSFGNEQVTASVCVTAYQHEKYIERCLSSIISQKTNFKFEIVLGEDESNDRTREICEKYKSKYPSLISLSLNSRKDVIYVAGFPTGRANFVGNIRRAKGKYLFFCDGDDYWTDNRKLQLCVEEMERNRKISMVAMRAEKRNESLEHNLGYIGDYGDAPTFFSSEEIVRSVGKAPLAPMQNFGARKEIFDLKILDELLQCGGSMHAIIHLLAATKGGAQYLPLTAAVYRVGSSSSVVAQRKLDNGGNKIFLWNQSWLLLIKKFSDINPDLEVAASMAALDRLSSLLVSKKIDGRRKWRLIKLFVHNVSSKSIAIWLMGTPSTLFKCLVKKLRRKHESIER